jgi:hypothetical protein
MVQMLYCECEVVVGMIFYQQFATFNIKIAVPKDIIAT